MGDGYHIYADRRALVTFVCCPRFVFRLGRGLVDESTSGPSISGPGGADGPVAATGTFSRHSALGSSAFSLPRGIPTVSGGALGDLQHECGG
jgi:hypothetical protein